MSDSWFVKISLRSRHAPIVRNGAFSHKIDYITIFVKEILNLKGHQNRITGLRVTAILLNGWIFPIGQSGEASPWRVCYQRGLPRLVLLCTALSFHDFRDDWILQKTPVLQTSPPVLQSSRRVFQSSVISPPPEGAALSSTLLLGRLLAQGLSTHRKF